MLTCAQCAVLACRSGEFEKMPKNCPMRDEEYFGQILDEYFKPDNHDFYLTSTAVEFMGYCHWPRLREVAEFAKRMGYTRLGIGFCSGLKKEASIVDKYLRSQGFEVHSIVCKTGGIEKTKVGHPEEMLINPGSHESMCNPIAQAQLLNREKTEFNICLGLCVGHDSMFYKYSEAPVTTLVAKDRATGHNPAAAIYCAEGYFKKRLNEPAK